MKFPAKPLSGKTALITGAARRLGRASALALAEAGANIAITYRNSDRDANKTVSDLESLGIQAIALPCDITSELSVRRMITATVKRFGRLDILVNNAANYETAAFSKITVAQWDAIFASNVRGPFLVSREARSALNKTRGKIINMGSRAACAPGLIMRITVLPRPRCTC